MWRADGPPLISSSVLQQEAQSQSRGGVMLMVVAKSPESFIAVKQHRSDDVRPSRSSLC
jgi:hypothetical protein